MPYGAGSEEALGFIISAYEAIKLIPYGKVTTYGTLI